MHNRSKIRLGLMGFGNTGRQIYMLASQSRDIEICAIADIGDPEILHYLLCSESDQEGAYQLDGNYLVCPAFKSRLMSIDLPSEMPWDVFDVDIIIDSTGKYRSKKWMQAHLNNGAPRVILRTLPDNEIDRIVIPYVNHQQIETTDKMISAGSATTTALAILINIISARHEIECVSATTIHAYTSDQALQDYAGKDFRRSRSAAENIIPNTHHAQRWMKNILPAFDGKVISHALNIPIHQGCLLDTNIVLKDSSVDAQAINKLVKESVTSYPGILEVTQDPIVSSDVIDSDVSLLFDLQATIKAGKNIIKTLSWYENKGHAARLLDVVRLYASLDNPKG